MIATLLVLQMAAAAPAAAVLGRQGVPSDPLTDSLRTAETGFMLQWRREWMVAPKPQSSNVRLAALHCHYDNSWAYGAPNLIRARASKRSMCPIWFPVDDSLPSDESEGIDNALQPDSRAIVRKSRENLIRRFSAAAQAQPDNPWISGQLVRLNVDQEDWEAALRAARACRGMKSWCHMLEGFVRAQNGHIAAADSLFTQATAEMVPGDRCDWTSIAPLLDERARTSYNDVPCGGARDSIDATFWWLADPLYLEPGNERRVQHFARQVLVRLHSALTIDERWDWRLRYGGDAIATMLVRYGWPSYVFWAGMMEDGGHFQWLAFRDSSINVSAEYALPRFHTAPPWHAVLDAATLTSADWDTFAPKRGSGATEWEPGDFPTELMARAGGPVVEIPNQMVMFRRDHTDLLAVGLDMPLRFLPPGGKTPYDAALVLARDANDRWTPARWSVSLDGTHTTVLSTPIATHSQVMSAEMAPADGARGMAVRTRTSIQPPAPLSVLKRGELAISDPLFFRPSADDDLPASAEDAIERMFGSTALTGTRAGVFWEIYGLPPTDTVEVTLRLTNNDKPGILRRIVTKLGVIGAEGGAIAVNWREPQPGTRSGLSYVGGVPVQARAVVLDISRLKAGKYTLELSVARPGGEPMTTRRDIVVGR